MSVWTESTNFSPSSVGRLIGKEGTISLPAGTPIFHEGDPGMRAYLIEEGQVEIFKRVRGRTRSVAVLGPGELFGEMSAIDGESRSATAIAVEETHLIPLSRTQLERKIAKADPLVALLLRVVLNRLRATQEQLAQQTGSIEAAAANDAVMPSDDAYQVARTRAVEQIKSGKALKEALERREFQLFYQPIVTSGRRRVAGFEALLRWHRSSRHSVSPSDFIYLAEDTGLIVPIGLWALDTACKALGRFQRQLDSRIDGAPRLFMSINVSARQLENLQDVDRIVETVRKAPVDPANIKLEITESIILENPDAAAVGLAKLKDLGVTLAVDDFGTGYSNLSYLHRFRLDTLKIDRSFVSTMLHSDDSLQIVRAIAGLARELEMEVIAEGVEDAQELAVLRELGCRYVQGFLCSKPVPETEVVQLLKQPVL